MLISASLASSASFSEGENFSKRVCDVRCVSQWIPFGINTVSKCSTIFRVSIWGKTPSTPAADNNSVAVPCHFPACSMYSATLQRYSGTAFSRCSSAVSSSSNSQIQFSSCRYSVRLSKSRPVRIMSAFLLVRLRCMTHVVSAAHLSRKSGRRGQTLPACANGESAECRCRTCLQGISAH